MRNPPARPKSAAMFGPGKKKQCAPRDISPIGAYIEGRASGEGAHPHRPLLVPLQGNGDG